MQREGKNKCMEEEDLDVWRFKSIEGLLYEKLNKLC